MSESPHKRLRNACKTLAQTLSWTIGWSANHLTTQAIGDDVIARSGGDSVMQVPVLNSLARRRTRAEFM
jgi:hypothetical protein